MAKILLINPPIRQWAQPNNPPLGLLYIASYLEAHEHKVDICDANALRVGDMISWIDAHLIKGYDFVGLSGLISTASKQKEILEHVAYRRELLKHDYKIILGGGLATATPDFAIRNYGEYLDYIIIDEGETPMLQLANGDNPDVISNLIYKDEQVWKKHRNRTLIDNLDDLPYPDYSKVPVDTYLANPIWGRDSGNSSSINFEMQRSLNMVISRGCPHQCGFCLKQFKTSKCSYRIRSVGNVINEIQELYDRYNIDFIGMVDDNQFLRKNWIMEFSEQMMSTGLKHKVRWGGSARIDCLDLETLRMARLGGCEFTGIGIECLDENTQIALSDGAVLEIMKLDKEEISGLNNNTLRLEVDIGFMSHKSDNSKHFIKLSTSVNSIECSIDHKLFTLNNNGDITEILAGDLNKDDYIAIASKLPIGKSNSISPDLADLLGFYIGDGSSVSKKGYRVSFASNNKSLVDKYKGIIANYFPDIVFNTYISEYANAKDVYTLHANSKDFKDWLKYLDLNVYSYDKFVPECILLSSEQVLCRFIQGYFDSDGSILFREGKAGGDCTITFTSTSYQLLNDVKNILWKLGILSYKIYCKPDKRGFRNCYQLVIKRRNDVKKFLSLIESSNDNRIYHIKRIKEYYIDTKGQDRSDIIPISYDFAKKVEVENNTCNRGPNAYGFNRIKGSFNPASYKTDRKRNGKPRRDTCAFMINRVADIDTKPYSLKLKKLVDSDIKWEKISKIESIETPDIMYDMSTRKSGNFIANGFIVHNSASPYILKMMNKTKDPEGYIDKAKDVIAWVKQSNITCNCTFMVGYLNENWNTLRETSQFMLDNDVLNNAFFSTPYPSTDLFEKVKHKIINKYGTIDNYIFNLADATEFRVNCTEEFTDEELIYARKCLIAGRPDLINRESFKRLNGKFDGATLDPLLQ